MCSFATLGIGRIVTSLTTVRLVILLLRLIWRSERERYLAACPVDTYTLFHWYCEINAKTQVLSWSVTFRFEPRLWLLLHPVTVYRASNGVRLKRWKCYVGMLIRNQSLSWCCNGTVTRQSIDSYHVEAAHQRDVTYVLALIDSVIMTSGRVDIRSSADTCTVVGTNGKRCRLRVVHL